MDPDQFSAEEITQVMEATTIVDPEVDATSVDPEEASQPAEKRGVTGKGEAPTAEAISKASHDLHDITQRTYQSLFPCNGRQCLKASLDEWSARLTDYGPATLVVNHLTNYVNFKTPSVTAEGSLGKAVQTQLEDISLLLDNLKTGRLESL
jgi:hypothetical protein